MIDIDKLIELVRSKSQLWDRGNRYHGNRHSNEQCWREIAEEMNEDEKKLRKKWKYLRDQFSVEYGKIPPANCEDDVQSPNTRWRYYKQLQFLEEVVTPRVTTKNPKRDESSDESQSARESCESVYKRTKKEKLRHKQKKKRSDATDEHLHFFKSLLPHVRDIPPHLQLSFRNKIQEVVEEFAYKTDAKPVKEPYFITCVPDDTKMEPIDEQDQDDSLILG